MRLSSPLIGSLIATMSSQKVRSRIYSGFCSVLALVVLGFAILYALDSLFGLATEPYTIFIEEFKRRVTVVLVMLGLSVILHDLGLVLA